MENIISINSDFSRFLSYMGDDENYYRFFIELDPLVSALMTIRPENIGITVINAKNMVYYYGYSFNREAEPFVNFPWMPEFSELGDKPFLTSPHDRPYALRDENRQVFSFVQRFWSLTSNSQGLMIIDFPLEVLGDLLGHNTNQSDSGTFMIDRENNILYPQNMIALSVMRDSLSKRVNRIETPEGKAYRMFYKTDPISGWTIASYFAQNSFYANIAKYRNILFIILLISTLICLLASMFISFRIAHPIMNLVRSMKDVKKGDLNQQIVVTQRDEIGQLGIEFNRMIRHIQQLIGKVYKQEKEKRAVEISALQAQINPHFLYNALEAINSLARNNKQPEISKQIALLGKLLRFSIATFKEFVPFEKEIQYVEHYLLINKLRMKENEFEFTLQNAILHGLEPAGRKGRIDIRGRAKNDDILITVEDNGVGIQPRMLQQIRYQLEHHSETLTKYKNKVGLFNVQTRIRLHYGPAYGITIDSSTNGGTTVQLLIPRRSSDE